MPNERKVDELLRELVRETGSCLSIVLDEAPDVFIALAEYDDGRLVYEVSDGPPGQRGQSWDVTTWDAAVVDAKRMQEMVPPRAL